MAEKLTLQEMVENAKRTKAEMDGRTNINNINYNNNNNNNNDNNYFKFVREDNKQENHGLTSSIDFKTNTNTKEELKSIKGALAPLGYIPPEWRGVKLDLFNNPAKGKSKGGLKLAISIIRQDGTTINLTAALNSPQRHVFRGRTAGNGSESFWNTLTGLMKLRNKESNYRVSKFSKQNKSGTVKDFGVILYKTHVWMVDIIRKDEVFSFALSDNLTDKMRKTNIIASKYYGAGGKSNNWSSLEDLGI